MEMECLLNYLIKFVLFSAQKNGSGIGLSPLQADHDVHRGNVQVQSVEGEGTAFLLQF